MPEPLTITDGIAKLTPAAAKRPPAVYMWDEYGVRQELFGFADWFPSPKNRDPQKVVLPTAWVVGQRCPQHRFKSTHVRVEWAKMPWNTRLSGFAVMFVCPTQHVWPVYIRPQ